jgi:hypothetical protein
MCLHLLFFNGDNCRPASCFCQKLSSVKDWQMPFGPPYEIAPLKKNFLYTFMFLYGKKIVHNVRNESSCLWYFFFPWLFILYSRKIYKMNRKKNNLHILGFFSKQRKQLSIGSFPFKIFDHVSMKYIDIV